MQIRSKTIFLALAPLCLAVAAITLMVHHQAAGLASRHQTAIEVAYLASTRGELKRQVELALRMVGHLYETGRVDPAVQRQARQVLAALEQGSGRAIFVYDQTGRDVLHPARGNGAPAPSWAALDAAGVTEEAGEAGEVEGAAGATSIAQLIERASKGGGYVNHNWPARPGQPALPRLSYVSNLPRWGWVIGSSVDMADVHAALAGVNGELAEHMHQSMHMLLSAVAAVAGLAVLAVLGATAPSLVAQLGARSGTHARARTPPAHQACLAPPLQQHICQWLASIRLQTETTLMRLNGPPEQLLAARCSFARTVRQVDDLLAEMQGLSPATAPSAPSMPAAPVLPALSQLQLVPALAQLCEQHHGDGAPHIRFSHDGELHSIPESASTLLLFVAEQALANLVHHGRASEINVRLHGGASLVMLQVRGNGAGTELCHQAPPAGGDELPPALPHSHGMHAMRAQLERIGGALALDTSSAGTLLSAVVARESSGSSGANINHHSNATAQAHTDGATGVC